MKVNCLITCFIYFSCRFCIFPEKKWGFALMIHRKRGKGRKRTRMHPRGPWMRFCFLRTKPIALFRVTQAFVWGWLKLPVMQPNFGKRCRSPTRKSMWRWRKKIKPVMIRWAFIVSNNHWIIFWGSVIEVIYPTNLFCRITNAIYTLSVVFYFVGNDRILEGEEKES